MGRSSEHWHRGCCGRGERDRTNKRLRRLDAAAPTFSRAPPSPWPE
jgi:hypothetical protein